MQKKKNTIKPVVYILLAILAIIILIYYFSPTLELFSNNSKPRIAVLIRGHMRNALENPNLKNFLIELSAVCDIDIYICTWFYQEAKSSYRGLNEDQKSKEVLVSTLNDYFKDFTIKTIDIQDDKDCVIHGKQEGTLTEATKMPMVGWKRMLWNMNRGVQLINTDIPYKFVLSIRIDFMNLEFMKTHHGYGQPEIIKWIDDSTKKDIQKIKFLKDTEFTGNDNIYIANIDFLKSFLADMTTKLDEKLPPYKDVVNQEYIFFREANK